ncbi:MAG: sugar acetyltransferase [Candidatus Wallbacteria bacterium HGW-Wallbacteria-1]|uniref:Sugar acetyltransferase n=1 Tax=Candidatus Wallbacteria bacterium HGW-Wallbacteria-1 TaxID=2013854 RepID=A0A2N1PK76_9BACT|nr:MAG: sugar acetyltransferase [Candidatus Wallbacteria bacterium HGW-Wallbacteria-1]
MKKDDAFMNKGLIGSLKIQFSDILIIGAGGHARVLTDLFDSISNSEGGSDCLCGNLKIRGYIDNDENLWGASFLGKPVLGGDEYLMNSDPEEVVLVNAIGSVSSLKVRRNVHDRFSAMGFSYQTLIHPFSWVSPSAVVEEGCQIMAGAIVQTGARIGSGTIVNTKASVDHDCKIGKCCHLAPGTTLSGNVTLGDGVHIGTGATVIQGIKIGSRAVIGAGAVVVSDIPDDTLAMGVPARVVRKLC